MARFAQGLERSFLNNNSEEPMGKHAICRSHLFLAIAGIALIVSIASACSNPVAGGKNPQELLKALLTTPISADKLPQGVTVQGNSAGDPDATAKSFKAVGMVGIPFTVASSRPPAYIGDNAGRIDGAFGYLVFPSASDAKGMYDIMLTQGSSRTVSGFGDPRQ
ncbi:MAG: hypothetical protein M1358_20175 [Chloroflexi bacterium]|nr:hypothetical protein [Chloroflexota bacterium]